MIKKIFALILFVLFLHQFVKGQKILHATSQTIPPKIDGKLDDEAWKSAEIATDFIVFQPTYGLPSSQKTEVKLVYTDEAIFISAYLYDSSHLIRKQLTSRDNEQRQDVDFFYVTFDTYKDKQNAFQFGVTSANVQSDARISPSGGDNDGTDRNWDAVWDSEVKMVSNGWIVEMKIPYMSLRFAKKDVQDWGINFLRFIRRSNESSYWNPVDPKVSGLINQFGELKGLKNLNPPLRLSLLPYVSTGFRTIPTNNGRVNNFLQNGGMDVKWGINESFTMDMTLIPDFGQTVSDNVVLNLSAFEQQFNENRPFFTEGTELFNKAGIFYSRRIGKTPTGYYDAKRLAADSSYKVLKNPGSTQLYNATKFSGRTRKNLGIGIFNAVTAPTYATFENSRGDILKFQTEPLTNYNIIVLDQALKNRSSISFTNTNVLRNGTARDANVSAIDLSFFDKKNNYNLKASGRYSHVTGNDPHNGYKTYLQFEKVSGKWQGGFYNNIESKYYDPNDLGILRSPNEFTVGGYASYQQFAPNKHFNYRNYSFNIRHTRLLEPFAYQEVEANVSFFHLFKNFWDLSLEFNSSPFWVNDYFDLRTDGRKVKKAPYVFAGLFGSTDSRKRLFIYYGLGFAESPLPKDPFLLIRTGARYRFSPKFSLELSSNRELDKANNGFAYKDSNDESVVGRRRVLNVNTILNGQYNFKARMNLTFRARHYWSRVNYTNLYHVDETGEWRNSEIAFNTDSDENFNTFNLDMFYTWDFKPGCRFIAAWKNALGPDVNIDLNRYTKLTQNIGQVLTQPHSNEVSVKFVYFIDYNKLAHTDKMNK